MEHYCYKISNNTNPNKFKLSNLYNTLIKQLCGPAILCCMEKLGLPRPYPFDRRYVITKGERKRRASACENTYQGKGVSGKVWNCAMFHLTVLHILNYSPELHIFTKCATTLLCLIMSGAL